MNKKGISVIVSLVVVIVFFMTAGSIYANFSSFAGRAAQEQVCRSTIVLGNRAAEGNIFTKEIGSGLLTSPYCATIVRDIQIEGDTDEEILKQATIALGSMMNSCWRQFGEGKIPNTFGQGRRTLKEWRANRENIYFPCYRFKFSLEDQSKSIQVADLARIDQNNPGTLWTYNIRGQKIDKPGMGEIIGTYAETGDRNYLSYAGSIVFPGNGYFEFIERYYTPEELDRKIRIETDGMGRDAGLAAGGVVAVGAGATIVKGGILLGAILGGPVVWAGIAVVTIGAGSAGYGIMGLSDSFYNKEAFVAGPPLTEIQSDRYYEIRYHAPYITDVDDNTILNNIKIVPAGAITGSTQRGDITIYE